MAREELELARARRATDALRREMEQERIEVAKREKAERIQREHEQRLEELTAYGRTCAVALPVEWRQQVISLLQEFVTDTNLPPSLPDHEARALVAAKVGQVREQYDAQQQREFHEALGRIGVQGLIESGRDAATRLTESWDLRDAEEARAEVARELARCVKPNWTEAEVGRRVENILDEWEEEEDEEEEDSDELEDGEEADAGGGDDGELDDEMDW